MLIAYVMVLMVIFLHKGSPLKFTLYGTNTGICNLQDFESTNSSEGLGFFFWQQKKSISHSPPSSFFLMLQINISHDKIIARAVLDL